jgi:cbb3-type cytochrome oxidase subunit 3
MLVVNVISTLKKLPSLSNVPENVLMAGIAAATVFAFVFFFLIVLSLFKEHERAEHEVHKASDPHKLIVDLHKHLINEMKGTSKQNALMINLTILFISISVIGIIASVLGPQRTAELVNQIASSVASLFSNVLGGFRGTTGK